MIYLGKSHGNQTEVQRHRTFSNLVLKGKFLKAVQFFYDRERGVFLQPYELSEYSTGTIKETATSVLEGGNLRKKIPPIPR